MCDDTEDLPTEDFPTEEDDDEEGEPVPLFC